MSGITHATQSPPESTPTKGAGSIDKSVVDHAEVVLEENAARSAKYQEEATNGKIIAESYAELSKQSASMRPDDARSADPCKIVAGGGGNYSLQSRNSHNFAATESSSVIHEDAATFLQAQASYKHERRNSRSPSRHSFDKHDDAVFTNNSLAVHDERKPVSSDALFKQPSTQNSSLSSGNRMSNTNQSARSAHHRHGRKTRPKAVVQNFDRPKDIFASSQDNEQKAGSKSGDRLFLTILYISESNAKQFCRRSIRSSRATSTSHQ